MDHSTHLTPRWRVFLTILVAVLTACGGGGEDEPAEVKLGDRDVASGQTLVYQSRESVQCGPAGLTPAQGAQPLIDGGIDVLKSGCGVMTGAAFAAVCGGYDGKILLHEIRKENLPDAERLGFESAATLRNSEGKGYAWEDCETGMPLP